MTWGDLVMDPSSWGSIQSKHLNGVIVNTDPIEVVAAWIEVVVNPIWGVVPAETVLITRGMPLF